ncbi:MAG: chromosome segregation protein SMC [Anaerovoracaceae bacterium]
MYFKKIGMHGFKSFAEPVNIEFSDGLTCIVGPNGSGKSNISDAIRWVLGEQSPKMLRGGKMEEVIFSGTSSRKSRGMAEVNLVIDNTDGSLPIDYKEISITRRMFKSGESEYYINGSQCRLRDIRELIMDTGIGVDGYSLIGQGKISDILSSKTESRREIFEEAAGIVMYRNKKAESERKLSSTNDNMDRVNDIIGEIEGRIGSLKEDSIKAKEYLKLKERYKELEINITLKNIENIESKNRYIKEDITELSRNIDGLKKNRSELERKSEEQEIRNAEIERDTEDARKILMETVDELNKAVNKEQVDRERLSAIAENESRLGKEISELEDDILSETSRNEQLANELKETERKSLDAECAVKEKEENLKSITDEANVISESLNEQKNDIFEISGRISSGRAEIKSLEMLSETLEKRKESLISERNTGEDSNRENIDRLNRVKTERDGIKRSLEDDREKLTEGKSRLEDLKSEEQIKVKETEALKLHEGRLTSRKKTIEEMENNYDGYNGAVKFVMKSNLKGIHGVVADLIKVPQGYEIAVETALGAALQNIICEDDASAKRAITALKENNAGRMTFLPVSSVKERAHYDGKLKSEKGFVGFGAECVDFDPKYEGIVNYLLGRVTIVEDMDSAIRMSKKSREFRYVTKDGEVVNSAGAMTGGRYRNKTANILGRKAEITSLDEQIAEKRKACENTEDQIRSIRDEIKELTASLSETEERVRRFENLVFEKEHEMKMIESMLSDIKSSGQRLEKELGSIESEKNNSLRMINEIREHISEDLEKLKEAELSSGKSAEKHDSKLREIEDLREDITKNRIESEKLKKQMENIADMVKLSEASLSGYMQSADEKKKQLLTIRDERKEILENGGNSEEAIEEIRIKKRNLESTIERLASEKNLASEESKAISSEKEKLSQDLDSMQAQKYELEIKCAKNETQLDSHKNKLWEDFEVSYVQAAEFKNSDFVMSSAVKENRQIKARIKELGEVNVGAIEEYDTVKERYDFLISQRADIQEAADDLSRIINDMDATIRKKFKESFDRIAVNFEEEFHELFGGGHAELRLSDEKNPLDAEIDIVAQPPGKKLQNINLMSGGEKTLTAIALMFAVLKAKPTPFCILDEVEAALDDANIDRLIKCLRKFSGIQFALVTHQKATMEHADVIYGVTMPEKGVSKVLSLDLGDSFDI